MGIFQLVVGSTVAARTPSQVASLEEGLRDAREFTAIAELQQMNRVNASFRIVKGVEIGFILAGLLLVLFFRQQSTWSTVGLGLLVEAAVTLAFDVFAQQRALVYTSWLRSLTTGASGA